jgi:hypothetical protein
LIPEVEGYVSIPGAITFHVPGAFVAWRYLRMDFEFLHPADAPARFGVPLCPELPSHGGIYVLPEGAPTPTPSSPLTGTSPPPPSDLDTWPAGTCYAGHFADAWEMPAGLQGQISGLSPGQVATITVYMLPPDPGENYAIGEAPPADASWIYPPEVTPLAEPPGVAPDWPLTATLTARNGPWGLVDPSLAGGKYLVIAQSPGQVVEPPAYEVVVFAGKVPGLPGGVDFVFEPALSGSSPATPSPAPAIALTPQGKRSRICWLTHLLPGSFRDPDTCTGRPGSG